MKIYKEDSSNEAWEFYRKKYYENSNWELLDNFDFNSIKTRYEKDGKYKNETRKKLWLKDDSKLKDSFGELFCFSGERVFNFDSQKYHLRPIIENSQCNSPCELNKKEMCLRLLKLCEKFYFSKYNLSLLPVTGGLNNLKGSLFFDDNGSIKFSKDKQSGKQLDRFDTFIFVVNEYYKDKEENTLLLSCSKNKPNEPCLIAFLETFKNVYDFCNKLYQLYDRKLIDMLIENGEKDIITINDVERYCQLALIFWATQM